MPNTIDQAFIKQFEADVHLAYQQRVSKLRHTVRTKNGVKGEKVRFQKVGKGSASTKTRNGEIPLMQAVHSFEEATLEDWYAGDYIDRLDEYKTNIDEKRVIQDTAAGAISRKMDNLIIAAGIATTTTVGTGAAAEFNADPSKNAFKALRKAIFILNKNEVPDDGMRIVLVTPDVWELLMELDKFSSSDYVGTDLPFLNGSEARKYLNCIWMQHTGLPITGDDEAQYSTCLVYHKTALGLAEAEFLHADIDWEGRKAAHFVNCSMSAGVALIDDEGCVAVNINHGLEAEEGGEG